MLCAPPRTRERQALLVGELDGLDHVGGAGTERQRWVLSCGVPDRTCFVIVTVARPDYDRGRQLAVRPPWLRPAHSGHLSTFASILDSEGDVMDGLRIGQRA
jgi:hypothetical protein